MKIAVMQPYFAPYLGYFQLINTVDKFIFYDDVRFIKGGWINRNYITLNGKSHRFTIPVKRINLESKINEVEIDWNCRDMGKLKKTLVQRFNKNEIISSFINNIYSDKPNTISDLSIYSIREMSKILDINTEFKKSSDLEFERGKDKMNNLIKICNLENSNTYINPIGGTKLYNKEEFGKKGVELFFIDGMSSHSIIDVIDLNGIEWIKNKLDNFKLI